MLEVTGSGTGQRSLEGDVADLKEAVTVLQQQTAVVDGRFEVVDSKFEVVDVRFKAVMDEIAALRAEMVAGHTSLEARLKLIVWLMGAGLTLYTGTTISLMVLLFQSVVA